MAIQVDYTKTGPEILSVLINAKVPGLTLIPSLLTAGAPAVNDLGGTKNTKITVTGVADSGYINSATLRYNRVDIATVPGARDVVFPKGDAEDVSDLIPEINARFGINITAADIVDAALPALQGTANEEVDFTLTIAATAMIYRGNVTLRIAGADIDLATAFGDNELDGLEYTQPA